MVKEDSLKVEPVGADQGGQAKRRKDIFLQAGMAGCVSDGEKMMREEPMNVLKEKDSLADFYRDAVAEMEKRGYTKEQILKRLDSMERLGTIFILSTL